ncbi:MAG: hypothetical protein IPN71_00835 [Fibrobacteres bacterium]|nr:hypothetical protein [Fibrobacterota bacterium]
MPERSRKLPRFPQLASIVVCCLLGNALAQIPVRLGDPRPVGVSGQPVGIAGSAFDVWVAYSRSMAWFPRLGKSSPRWYGTSDGLPPEGIASLCHDETTQSLWITSTGGRSLRWSQGLESAQESTPPPSGCQSRIAVATSVASLPGLRPSLAGWVQIGSELSPPDGKRQRVLSAMVLDGRELWLATDLGVWTGNAATGRIEPLPLGPVEPCAKSALVDSAGNFWLTGCHGTVSLVDASGQFRGAFSTDDSRYSDLRDARVVGASGGGEGVWVSVVDGMVRLDRTGVRERWMGRKAPFGGRVVSSSRLRDTLWVATENSILCKKDGDKSFRTDLPPWRVPGGVRRIMASPAGVLVATTDGFWWKGSHGWGRPAFVDSASPQAAWVAAQESRSPWRVVWSDGRGVRVDTLPGFGGGTGRWTTALPIHDLAFDATGMVHLAMDGSWSVWNPRTNEHRDWSAGLGMSGPVRAVAPSAERILLAGESGASTVKISPYAPGQSAR